jgi:hypothetical protein
MEEDKKEKKQQLLANKELSKEEIKRLRKEKKLATKKNKIQKLKEEKSKPKKSKKAKAEEKDINAEEGTNLTVEEVMESYYGKLHHKVIQLGLKFIANRIFGDTQR